MLTSASRCESKRESTMKARSEAGESILPPARGKPRATRPVSPTCLTSLALIPLILLVQAFVPSQLEAQTLIQVTKNGAMDWDVNPELSDDGGILAWIRRDPGYSNSSIWVADTRTNRITSIAPGVGPVGRICLSGDGRTIFYDSADSSIWSVPAPGGPPKLVRPKQAPPYSGHVLAASYDGSLVCYSVGWLIQGLEILNVVTGRIQVLPNLGLMWGDMSGDGKWVAFPNGGGLWLASVDGTQIRRLYASPTPTNTIINPKIDRYGTTVVFEMMLNGTYLVRSMQTHGSIVFPTSGSPGSWNRGPMLATDGDRVTWICSPTVRQMPADIVMGFPEGGVQRRLTPFGTFNPNMVPYVQHTLNGNGTVAAFTTTANYLGGNPEGDSEIFLWKDALIPSGTPMRGATIHFHLEDRSRPHARYVVRCAFSRVPGITVPGVGTVHLAPDALFFLSGQAPSIFRNFAGTLDQAGRATASVSIPNVRNLRGLTFYTSFLTVGPSGIALYNPVKTLVH
jgi:hypothetical protein